MSHPGTYVNAPTLGVTGLVPGDPDTAVSFDPASDQYVVQDDTVPQQTFSAFTIGAIIKPNNANDPNAPNFWGFVGSAGINLTLGQTGVSSKLGFIFSPGDGFSGFASFNGATTIADGNTYRVIATWDGTTAKLYVDGALDGSMSFSIADIIAGGGSAWVLDEDLNFYAATDQFNTTGNFSLDGTLDELFFVANHAATAPELATIDAAMSGTGSVEAAINALSPYIYWRLGEASGTVAADSASTPADPPTVTGVSPAAGTADGGTTVTIVGTALTGATDVFFGASNAASFIVVDDSTITAVTPTHSHISVHVTVVTPWGTSPTSAADVFSFTGDPPVEPDPVTIRVIDIDGNPHTASGLTDGELPLAMCKSITRVPNAPKTAEIVFPRYAYTRDDVHLFADDSGTGDLHLIEVVRNSIVRFRGVAVVADSQSSDGEVTLHCQGLDWILGRRYLDGQRTNELTNPSFETGDETGWTDVGAMTSTVTTDDAVRGTYSLRLESITPLGDIYTKQVVSIHGTGVGTFVTIVQYFKLESIGGHALDRRGLYVEARDGGVLKGNNYYAIDEATPTGEWIRAKTTIAVPPLATWDIEVRLYSPPGSILWDDGQVVAMQSISTATITGNTYEPVDVSEIVGLILDHIQDPSVGKSDLHLGLDNPTVGVKQVKHIQWADHIAWSDQMAEWLERDDCFDYAIRTNLDGTNELALLVPYAGTDRRSTVTLTFPEGNIASFDFTEDGGGTVTDDTELDDDTGDGPDREEGHYADASLIGGLTLQSINAAPTKSEPSSLDPLAREKVKKARRPAQLIKATLNGAALLSGTPCDELLGIGDRLSLDIAAGWIAVSGEGRISQLTEYLADRRLEVTVAVAI